MSCKNCRCDDCKEKIPINRCIKCGSEDIEISNCGYSSFNCGTGKCNSCGNKVPSTNGSWSNNDWIIREWNDRNPLKDEELRRLEEKLKKTKEKIKEVKARKW